MKVSEKLQSEFKEYTIRCNIQPIFENLISMCFENKAESPTDFLKKYFSKLSAEENKHEDNMGLKRKPIIPKAQSLGHMLVKDISRLHHRNSTNKNKTINEQQKGHSTRVSSSNTKTTSETS